MCPRLRYSAVLVGKLPRARPSPPALRRQLRAGLRHHKRQCSCYIAHLLLERQLVAMASASATVDLLAGAEVAVSYV